MRNGWLYELPTWAPPTGENDYSVLLGTPAAADADGTRERRGGKRSNELLLKGQVKALLPTPRTTDANGAGEDGVGGNDLRTTVNLLPTPHVGMSHESGKTRNWGGDLTGALTNQRLDAGNTNSDDPPQRQLTIEDA
jgi:hypothetical protein